MKLKSSYWQLKNNQEDIEILNKAAHIIKNNGLVAFPTETVYGLGANGLSSVAVEKIFLAKGRPSDNPLILHIAEKKDVYSLAKNISINAEKLMDAFWPGPLTVILPKQGHIPDAVTAGLNTVAIRMPKNDVARDFIRLCQVPIAAPSANISGRPSPTDATTVQKDLDGKVDAIIDGGQANIGLESTVVDCTSDECIILRPGGITKEQLEKVVAVKSATQIESDKTPKAPGMKYKHYSPKASVYLFTEEFLQSNILFLLEFFEQKQWKVGVLASQEVLQKLPKEIISFGGWQCDKTDDLAKNLYRWLRDFDKCGVEIILVSSVRTDNIGQAIMNRLEKAAQTKIIENKQDFDSVFA